MPSRKRSSAAPKVNGTPASVPPPSNRLGITIPPAPPHEGATPFLDWVATGRPPEPSERVRLPMPPMPSDMAQPTEFEHPRHPLAAMGPELRHLDIGRMPEQFGPMVSPEQIEDQTMEYSGSADVLDQYLMDYFRKNGYTRTLEQFARDSRANPEGNPGVDTPNGLLVEYVWLRFPGIKALIRCVQDLADILAFYR
ncbi:hypothetical protein CALVIDRAFT_567586 [Calocera viscosa TUFC12733]|uniref:Uncharacterized protein n=1 Tax=Calocera viscosa (strain TUFC12733) TaxID=1330018 RepID=A0A167I0Z0_CALVF|nr:hypothetical protein CALVIDRAFT_567586 [Calocera viscosa TUFC12733]